MNHQENKEVIEEIANRHLSGFLPKARIEALTSEMCRALLPQVEHRVEYEYVSEPNRIYTLSIFGIDDTDVTRKMIAKYGDYINVRKVIPVE